MAACRSRYREQTKVRPFRCIVQVLWSTGSLQAGLRWKQRQYIMREEESAHQQADGSGGRLGYRLSGPASVQGSVHRIDDHIQAAPHFPELHRWHTSCPELGLQGGLKWAAGWTHRLAGAELGAWPALMQYKRACPTLCYFPPVCTESALHTLRSAGPSVEL